jgi:hypothetical protein
LFNDAIGEAFFGFEGVLHFIAPTEAVLTEIKVE